MAKQNVLFICIHNSARSQMAEAWLNYICPDDFETDSAGLEPGTLNSFVVEVMREVGMETLRWGDAIASARAKCARAARMGAPFLTGVS